MQYSDVSDLPMVEEEQATEPVAQIYAAIKREMQLPIIPNLIKALAVSPPALAIYWDVLRSFYQYTTLPESLTAMILFTIAETGNWKYCSAGHEPTCRTLGIDQETLRALVEELGSVTPERLRVIIEFAAKASHDPQGLVAEDYARVREQGVTDAELVEIILVAATANYVDTLADALKIEVDPMVTAALGR